MSRFLDENVRAQLQLAFENLVNSVQLVLFTQKNGCNNCTDQEELLKDVASLSNKLILRSYDIVLNGDEAVNYRIDKIPATIIVDKRNFGIRFFGLIALL
jgi:alkyl hydroperoxide reductase subunit AhpF